MMPEGDYAEPDPLYPEQRIYANAVVSAIRKYNEAVKRAENERNDEIAEAMRVCMSVLNTRKT